MPKSRDKKFRPSPTSLTRFYESEFASWMDHYHTVFRDEGPLPRVHRNPPDPLQGLLAEKGIVHETSVLKQLKKEAAVTEFERGQESSGSLREKTLKAMERGEPYIYQAALGSDAFFGYADLLQKVPGSSSLGDYHYEPLDMKISMSPKPTAILQLCAYADALGQIQGKLPERMTVITRDGASYVYRTERFFAFYTQFKKRFLNYHDEFDSNNQPLPIKGNEHRDWSIYAKRMLHERDDVQLTARIRTSHVEKLREQGIHTVSALSKVDPSEGIVDVGEEALSMLQKQADLQVRSNSEGKVLFEVLDHPEGNRVGLAMLPDAHPKDIFFDMEGYLLLGTHGLEYLYGVAERGEGKSRYLEFWAKSVAEEIDAFKAFMEHVYAQWQKNSGMHIYHYGHYEQSTLRRLMSQYGVCEKMMNEMLKQEVFVDLYQVVVQGVRVGTYAYGLKSVEKIYYPERETEVGSGAESAVAFSQYLETGDERFLDRIRVYNQDDCFSTKDLEAFLRKQKDALNITYLPLQSQEDRDRESDPDSVQSQCSQRALELLEEIPSEKRGLLLEEADPRDYVQELLAHMLEFHKREDGPDWSEYFRRRDLSYEQLFDEVSALAGVEIVGHSSEGHLECKFDPSQDSKFRSGQQVLILENEHPFENLKIEQWDILKGSCTLSGQPKELPEGRFTLAPARSNINKNALLQSLLDQATEFNREASHFGLRDSVYDLLLRKPPRVGKTKVKNSNLLRSDETVIAGITRIVSAMEGGCLCIQGPPGTGKTYTGSHVITELLKQGKTVAISSNSHKAISNLLKKVDEVCMANREICRPVKLTSGSSVKKEADEYSDSQVPVKSTQTSLNVLYGSSKKPLHPNGPVNLTGATAFHFCKSDHIDRFDYLFIDEATQVCLANLVAMARSAKNIVLMGDQMQLDQPTQATHPGDSGSSALVHITAGKSVIDPKEGVFLPVTYRMHSAVNNLVSELFYEGELRSDPSTDNYTILWKGPQRITLPSEGIHFVPVEHKGNTHGSEEEAKMVKQIVTQALKSQWQDKTGQAINLTYKDILIVSPYNYQVSLLKETLANEEARIGSVDLFQGQEAPLVILSLCASSAKDAPRGISFLLNRNRMNVALSRAQSLAVVVGSPGLATGRASTIEGMELLNVICRLNASVATYGR